MKTKLLDPFFSAAATLPLFCFLLFAPCRANTPIAIEYKVNFCVNDSGLRGMFIKWTFDEVYSAFLKTKYDADKNGTFDKTEQVAMFSTSLENFKENHLFMNITINGKSAKIPEIRHLGAGIEKESGRVFYSFFLPLEVPARTEKQDIELYFLDKVMDITFGIHEKDVDVQNISKSVNAATGIKLISYINHPTLSFSKGNRP
jgi:ABC-type uncharacterized transport system substrate-binding protein